MRFATDAKVTRFWRFIDWKGCSESIRQNAIFDDFFRLAEAETTKTGISTLKGLTTR
jgi:hypothetical protein